MSFGGVGQAGGSVVLSGELLLIIAGVIGAFLLRLRRVFFFGKVLLSGGAELLFICLIFKIPWELSLVMLHLGRGFIVLSGDHHTAATQEDQKEQKEEGPDHTCLESTEKPTKIPAEKTAKPKEPFATKKPTTKPTILSIQTIPPAVKVKPLDAGISFTECALHPIDLSPAKERPPRKCTVAAATQTDPPPSLTNAETDREGGGRAVGAVRRRKVGADQDDIDTAPH
ncbi:hypothetical protein PUN28_009755 [Cardiocondyla obscurior]|uniref:Uncharacterized protein n=1 Tax=Cardiocondyla obscurior TaxID=286306 RepID=A0AAW2FK89_9HYME